MIQAAKLQPEARVGQVIDDRYRIVQHLASGGMASVYRAEHLHNSGLVAIKVLHGALADNEEVSARFRREALAARSIRHPNVVSVWDVGRLPDGCSFMVLELIPGEDLCTALHREKAFSQVRAVKIALQISHALVSAHAAGVIHRDLKPDNIMLIEREGDPDFVKVVDFGIAKVMAQGVAIVSTVGSVFGTPEYMAPEQARGGTVDQRTDLYTLGTVLYEMLAGTTPFAHKSFAHVLMGQLSQAPPPLPEQVDPELSELVGRLLAKDPGRRFQTAADLREALRAILHRLAPGHPVLASTRPAAQGETPPRPSAVHSVAPKSAATASDAPVSSPVFASEPVSSTIAVVRPVELPPMRPPPTPHFERTLEGVGGIDGLDVDVEPFALRACDAEPLEPRRKGESHRPILEACLRRMPREETVVGLGPQCPPRIGLAAMLSSLAVAESMAAIGPVSPAAAPVAHLPPRRLHALALLGWGLGLAILLTATYFVVRFVCTV